MPSTHLQRRARLVVVLFISALIIFSTFALWGTAYAANVTVNSTVDNGPGNCTATCTLRDAITTAGVGDTIMFDPSVFSTSQTITLSTATLTISKNLTIQGPGANILAVDGSSLVTVFTVNKGVTAFINDLTVQHGKGSNGGGINNNGTLTLNNIAVSANQATHQGGGINNTGTLKINNSTISGNSDTFPSGGAGGGGGIDNDAVMTISNSTISGNTAVFYGGGIINNNILTVANSTISGNSVTVGGSGCYGGGILNQVTVNLGSTIIAGNTAPGCTGPDFALALHSLGYNVIGNNSGASGLISTDQQNVNPLLNGLALNDLGTTETMSLQNGSAAIQRGNCNLASPAAPVSTDQRGAPRGTPCDVGAYESGLPRPTPTSTSTRTPTRTSTPSRTATNTRTPTNTKTPTITRTPSNTLTPSITRTPTDTRTATATRTATRTATNTSTPTNTRTATDTRTPTATRTPTRTRTPTPTRTPPPPGKVTLISPKGPISITQPTYTWTANAGATKYYLVVTGPNGQVFSQWYTSDSTLCTVSQCQVKPNVTLTNGPYSFWVETWNSYFYGPWSTGATFSVTNQLPDMAVQLTPLDGESVTVPNPAFTWQTATNAEWYYLVVRDGNNNQVFGQWYIGSTCVNGTCSATPTLNLASGTYSWWVLTWGGGLFGPWSLGRSFTVSLPGAPIAPTFAPGGH